MREDDYYDGIRFFLSSMFFSSSCSSSSSSYSSSFVYLSSFSDALTSYLVWLLYLLSYSSYYYLIEVDNDEGSDIEEGGSIELFQSNYSVGYSAIDLHLIN